LVSEEFPPYMFGGIAVVCRDLAINLARRGIQTTVLCGNSRPPSIEHPIENLTIIRLPLSGYPPRPLWFQVQNYSFLLKLLEDVDVFHAVDPLSAAIPMYFGKRHGTHRVTHIHSTYRSRLMCLCETPIRYWTVGDIGSEVLEYPFKASICSLFKRASDHFIACSLTTLREFRAYYPEVPPDKFTVIYNGIDLKSLDGSQNQNDGEEYRGADHSLVFYGRLFWNKGILHLIKSLDILRRTISDIELDIYGTGPLENTIKNLISQLGLHKIVHLKGMIPKHEDLIARVKNYNAVVLPSIYEGQPVAALEAMALSKPLVMFDTTFSREFIENMTNGVLARPCNIADLARQIEIVLTDTKLAQRLGEKARNYVEQNHNWDSLVEKYIEVYQTLTEQAN